jgi:RND superfamily putative drug exporter
MAPLAMNLSDHLSYDGSKFMSGGTDSSTEQAVYDQQFPSGSQDSMVVVVQSNNSSQSATFIDQLNNTLENDTALENMTQTDSLYSVQQMMLSNMTPSLHQSLIWAQDNISNANDQLYQGMDDILNASNGLYWLYDNVTTTNSQFYQARKQILSSSSQLYSARDQVQGMADIFDGIPADYMGKYIAANASGEDDYNSSTTAYNQANADIANNPSTSGSDKQMAEQYLMMFNGAWSNPSDYSQNPQVRAQNAINSAAPTFISEMKQAGQLSSSEASMMQSIVSSISLATYISPGQGSAIDNLVISMAATQGGVSQSSIATIYDLGRNPSDGTIGNYLTSQAISTMENSDAGKNMSASDLQNATDMINEAWNIGGTAIAQDFDNWVLQFSEKGLNAAQQQNVQDIWDMGPDPNQTVIENYEIEQAANSSGIDPSELDEVGDIIALGRNASSQTIQAYLANKTMNSLNITGDPSYFLAVMNLDRNMSNASLEAFGTQWAETHNITDPDIIPSQLASQLVSGNVSLYAVMFNTNDSGIMSDNVAELRNKITQVKNEGGFTDVNTYVTGNDPITVDTKTASIDDVSNIDVFTIGIVLILLLIYFRSFFTPFVPLFSIVIAIVASMGVVTLLSYFMGLYYIIEEFMVIIMMGAGIDYCVFMLSRYKEERHEGHDVKSSVVTTVQYAGKSIASSGLTAALGFAALTLSGEGMFVSMGIGVSIGLVISMLSALTLIPAILTLLGDRMFWPNKIYNVKTGFTLSGLWESLSRGVIKHAKMIILLTILLAVPTVYYASHVTTGSDLISMLPNNIESKQGFDVLDNSMGSGAMTQTTITVTLPVNITDQSGNRSIDAMNRIESISAMIAGIKDVKTVYSITRPDGTAINYQNLSVYNAIVQGLYNTTMNNDTGLDDRTTYITVTLDGDPYSSGAFTAVDRMKAMLENNSSGALQGTVVHIGGGTAQTEELAASSVNGFIIVLPIVIIGIMIILLLLLRSMVLPVRIMLTLGMSILMTLAAYVIIFQMWQNEPMLFELPVLFFCALMGVGVDYDIFLVTRVEEEMQKGMSVKDAITKAMSSTGTIILICALVMAGAFGSLLLSSMEIMSQLGFILSLGILIQAILMMMIVVPAIKSLLGKHNWWMPGRKSRFETIAVTPQQQEEKIEK